MSSLAKRTYDRGWSPDCDAVNAPADALLRADNVIHDELGVLGVRQGSNRLYNLGSPVHSLFTVVRNGTRLRYAGAGNAVFRNGSSLVGMAGSGDIAFGSYLGQTFFARSTSRFKDEGGTVRNWGISMTGGQPVASAAIVGDSKEYASWDSWETGEHHIIEDSGDGAQYAEGYDAHVEGAIVLRPSPLSGRIVVNRTFTVPQDVTFLDAGREATDDDFIVFYMYASNPNVIIKTTLQIDVNGGLYNLDWFHKDWLGQGVSGPDGSVNMPGTDGGGEPIFQAPGEIPMV